MTIYSNQKPIARLLLGIVLLFALQGCASRCLKISDGLARQQCLADEKTRREQAFAQFQRDMQAIQQQQQADRLREAQINALNAQAEAARANANSNFLRPLPQQPSLGNYFNLQTPPFIAPTETFRIPTTPMQPVMPIQRQTNCTVRQGLNGSYSVVCDH